MANRLLLLLPTSDSQQSAPCLTNYTGIARLTIPDNTFIPWPFLATASWSAILVVRAVGRFSHGATYNMVKLPADVHGRDPWRSTATSSWSSRDSAVYVFRKNELDDQVAKLTASDAVDDWFGYSVAIDGDTIVVGAPGCCECDWADAFRKSMGQYGQWPS